MHNIFLKMFNDLSNFIKRNGSKIMKLNKYKISNETLSYIYYINPFLSFFLLLQDLINSLIINLSKECR